LKKETSEWYPEYVTTGFVAKRFGVSNTTVLRWIEKGILKSFKLPGGQNRIHRDVLRDFMTKNAMSVNDAHLMNSEKENGEQANQNKPAM
jgi:excisionase family DNA binding protein